MDGVALADKRERARAVARPLTRYVEPAPTMGRTSKRGR